MGAKIKFSSAVLGVAIAVGGLLSAGQNQSQPKKHDSKQVDKPGRTAPADNGQDEGERVFTQHCSRCHNAPDSLSPRISGTIVRHMRVRANLTAEEERAVLHFFNP